MTPTRALTQRRSRVANQPGVFGLEYAELLGSQDGAQLRLHFVPHQAEIPDPTAVPPGLEPSNVRVIAADALERQRLLRVGAIAAVPDQPNAVDAWLATEQPLGDAPARLVVTLIDVAGLDPTLSQVDVRIWGAVPAIATGEDAGGDVAAMPATYLARDAESLLRVAQERLRVTAPRWRERSPADLGVTVLELLAHAADVLGYYQDAVAAEAYLGTARRRASLRRHARLLDYPIDDGCNARVWMRLEATRRAVLPAGTAFATRGAAIAMPVGARPDAVPPRMVFESLHSAPLSPAHNLIGLYGWQADRWVIDQASTEAVLDGHYPELTAGDALILAQLLDPAPGTPASSPSRRAVVRLSAPPALATDPIAGRPITRIQWHTADALPFPLVVGRADERPLAAAYGNVVLADHGASVAPMQVRVTEEGPPAMSIPAGGHVAAAVPYDDDAARLLPAAESLHQDPRAALPCVTVEEHRGDRVIAWQPRRDLLASGRFDRHFTAELRDGEVIRLRFGDGELGRRMLPGTALEVRWRLGGGPDGNVGHDSVVELVEPASAAVSALDNPLPASGGCLQQRASTIRRDAPEAFRTQDRLVTARDFTAAARRVPRIADAAARFSWTGSWRVAVVHVLPEASGPLDPELRKAVECHLRRRALAGAIVEVHPPRWVPVALTLRVAAAARAGGGLQARVLERLAAADLAHGKPRGFIRRGAYAFGETIYLAPIVAAVAAVPGVAWVEAARLERVGQPGSSRLEAGFLAVAPTEMACLEGTTAAPERGYVEIAIEDAR